MTADLLINNNLEINVAGYSVKEDSTPVSPLDKTGGVSDMTFQIGEDNYLPGDLMGQTVDLNDSVNGTLRIRVDSLSGDDFMQTINGTSILRRLNSTIYVPPAMGVRLDTYLDTIFDAVGISAIRTYENNVGALLVTAIGWRDVLLDKLKDICVRFDIEIAAIAEQVIVRSTRQRIAETSNTEDVTWTMQRNNLATQVAVVDYDTAAHPSNTIVYPTPLGTGAVISVDGGETRVTNLKVPFSLASIVVPQYGVLPKYDTSVMSTYAVIDGKNNIVPSDKWLAGGGKVDAKIDPKDDKVIIVTVTGHKDKSNGPYRIALPDGAKGTKSMYNALRIIGTGVKYATKTYTVKTGVPTSLVTDPTERKVDNIFANNRGQAFGLAKKALCFLSTYDYKINVETDYVNRLGETGILTGATYQDFDLAQGTKTYATWDTEQGVKTYAEFQTEQRDLYKNDFENQAFGNVGGARRRYKDAWFRIRSATIGAEGISYSAENDTTWTEFADNWNDGATYAQFDTKMGTTSYMEFGVRPLWKG